MVFGRDIKDNWNIVDGDLETVSNTSNLAQAIINRLNADLGFYDWCYTRYGGDLFSIFGMKNNVHTLEYLRIEIESILKQDPRIKDITVECSKESPKTIYVELNILSVGSNELITLNLVITDEYKVQIYDGGI